MTAISVFLIFFIITFLTIVFTLVITKALEVESKFLICSITIPDIKIQYGYCNYTSTKTTDLYLITYKSGRQRWKKVITRR